jgi:hypothetical protein
VGEGVAEFSLKGFAVAAFLRGRAAARRAASRGASAADRGVDIKKEKEREAEPDSDTAHDLDLAMLIHWILPAVARSGHPCSETS